MERTEIKNAIIKSAKITTRDGDFLTVWVDLDYGCMNQRFGGYALYLPKSFNHHALMSVAGHFIFRLMEVSGVTDFNDLAGKSIRVKCTHTGIDAIGHIVKDDWFFPVHEFGIIYK
jgi:hypothetical protein